MRIEVQREEFSLSTKVTGRPEGSPVVLMSNSLGTTLEMWDVQAELLGQSHRVIRYDTRGHGLSGTPPGPYIMQDFVDDAIAVLDHFDVAAADMIGLSLGAMTGLGLALAAPSRLNRLVVSAARADAPAPVKEGWDNRIAIIEEKGVSGVWAGSLKVWLTDATVEANPSRIETLKAHFLKTTDAGYIGCAKALKGLDYLKDLGRITTPTLFISGSKDVGAASAVMKGMAEATPVARYVDIAGAAHIINIDAPDAYNDAIGGFLT